LNDTLPAFVDLETVPRIKEFARVMAMLQKLLAATRKTECLCLRTNLKSDLREYHRFIKLIAENSKIGVADLESIRKDVQAYRDSLDAFL
jgi:hypothetical protein